MIVKSEAAKEASFEGLTIRDYTPDHDRSSSLATVEVPPGVQHRKARSTRSDKYYYVIEGKIHFTLGDDENHLERETSAWCQREYILGTGMTLK